MVDLTNVLTVAVSAVAQASGIIRSQQPGVVTTKGDRDIVSEVDYAVERSIREFLAQQTPEIGFLGEEGGRVDSTSDLLWVLDPVDGTANFVRGIPLCAVSLALLADHQPIVGAIEMPFLGARYTAARGYGAACNDVQIYGSRCQRLEDAIIAIGDYAVGVDAAAKNAARLALTASLVERVVSWLTLGWVR